MRVFLALDIQGGPFNQLYGRGNGQYTKINALGRSSIILLRSRMPND